MPRWLLPLFVVLALAQLVPVWSVHYLPTTDGPAHVYSSWLLGELIGGSAHPAAELFAIDWRPHPNWLGHALMAMAMTLLPPLVAEKLLVSMIVILFLAGAWVLARENAFVALPLVHHQLLQFGFYNFSLSVGLCLLIVGLWWRRRSAIAIAVLTLLCWFAHPVSTAIAIVSCVLLALMRRSDWRRLTAFLPVAPLFLWFVAHRGTDAVSQGALNDDRLDFLTRTQILLTFDVRQLVLGRWLFVAIVVLLALTLLPRVIPSAARNPEALGGGSLGLGIPRDARDDTGRFLVVAGAMVLVYFVVPSTAAGGQLLSERMALFIPLLVLPALALPRRVVVAVAIVFAVIAVANAAFLTAKFRLYDRFLRAYLAPLERAEARSSLLPLVADGNTPGSFVSVIPHATDYACALRGLVQLDNYEPAAGYFPIRFREGTRPPPVFMIEAMPGLVNPADWAPKVDYLFTYKRPVGGFALVAESGDARLYRSLVAFEATDAVLLPLAGTTGEIGAPYGARWRVDQSVRNLGRKAMKIRLNTCAAPPCVLELRPGAPQPLASADGTIPFLLIGTQNGRDARQLAFRTTARRVDALRPDVAIDIPAVPLATFRTGAVALRRVEFSRHVRVNLRAWLIGGTHLRVRLRRGGAELASKEFAIDPGGFFTAPDLVAHFPQLSENEERLDVEVEALESGARVWAFVAVTNNETQVPVMLFPN